MGWEEGIEVPPAQGTGEQFPGSSWSERLAEAQERERKMSSAQEKVDCVWLWWQLTSKATDEEGRQDNRMTQRKGNVVHYQDLMHPSRL